MTNNGTALEVEIGCGKGKFLVARAQVNPHIRFIGIDKSIKWMRRGIRRSERQGLANLVFLKGWVLEILEKEIADASVSVFHIYFPDPWPKRRHHKRRLLQNGFFSLLRQKLKPGGLVEVATDDADYFEAIKKETALCALPWGGVREGRNERLFPSDVKTNYELKYEADGRELFYLELCK
ncbi:MAG: tRNA (guanosine(46)-N7)-methyltransferase TrmB [Deltaproteobacteria bacterium]|nr:tRNA (guanosine(46)-N7)-methyltransferase TrmB [Deltaproteobacteria bacterium]